MTHSPDSHSPTRYSPTRYRLRVNGHLEDYWSAWFGGLTLTHENDGTTSLSGDVSDQAALHGLLTRVRDLGLTLIGLEAIDPGDPSSRIGPGAAVASGTCRPASPPHAT